MKLSLLSIAIAAGMGLAPACAVDDFDKPDSDDTKTDDSDFKAERWGGQDRPNGFAADLEYNLSALPAQGQPNNRPWASNYWPTYGDSINFKWDGAGSKSAAQKMQDAFGGTNVENRVSQYYGIDRYKSSRTACTADSECDSNIGEACAKREGASEGVCIPTWWGICHAWAPLAVLMPEPKFPVTHNGVEFKINDIKALITLAYNGTSTKFVSQRCNVHPNDIARDAYGRPSDENDECRDTNAGTLHVLVTNYLGLRKQSFVYDRTYSDEVWNQPLDGYRITMQEEVDARRANELIGVTTVGGRQTTASGTVAKDAWQHESAVNISAGESLTVVMSGSGDADLYVRFGSQPTTSSYDCRPYAGGSGEECTLTAPEGVTQAFVSVRGYAATSNFDLNITVGGGVPNDYFFNSDATKLVHVKMELDYITESHAETDGHFGPDPRYIRTDRYEYILELEGDKIIGGEYIGASKSNHPDFLWLPLDRRNESLAGGALKWADIKLIYDKSLVDPNGGGNGGGNGGFELVTDAATVAKNAWKHYGPFEVATGGKIKASISGTGDADLYVRKNSAPTAQSYDCRPYKNGSTEACTLEGAGTYYVSVRGYATTSDFDIEIEHIAGTGGGTPPVVNPPTTIDHLNLQDEVAQGAAKHFTLVVPAGATVTVKTFAAADVDLYLQVNGQPTTSEYLARAWTTSGNETLTYTATSSVTLNIMVHGYEASNFTLRTE